MPNQVNFEVQHRSSAFASEKRWAHFTIGLEMTPCSTARPRLLFAGRALIGLLVATSGCNFHDCLQIPCPLPIAVDAVVMSATGSALPGLFVQVGAPITATIACDAATGRCVVPGSAGNYVLRFGAPGFQTMQRTVTVSVVRATGACGCDAVTTQPLQVTLQPL